MKGAGGAALLGAALSLSGCGGAAPLLHPAHTLPRGAVTFAAGTSGQFVLGDAADAEASLGDDGQQSAGTFGERRRRAVQGALTRLALAPGLTPFVAARVGLGQHNEGGITYTGRTFRIDARHAFEWPNLALSAGLGGVGVIGALPRASSGPSLEGSLPPAAELRHAHARSARGYGLELPLMFGYRSDADVVQAWVGARLGAERTAYGVSLAAGPSGSYHLTSTATRRWVGGLVGFSVGLSPIDVRVELDAAYEHVSGALEAEDEELRASVAGLSLAPAMAISAKF